MGIDKKKQLLKKKLLEEHGKEKCTKTFALMDLLEEANIPVGYWFLKMKDFNGSPVLKKIIDEYTADIQKNYLAGRSICLAGNQGTGKTMSSICVAKEAIKQGFSAYYTTASDMLNEMTTSETRSVIRPKLRTSDFLIIDELDSRFFPSSAQKELFSGIYESIFRYRAHNTLPTLICTNETNDILDVFYGAGVQSIRSLNKQYLTIYPVVGKDFRKQLGESNEKS